jgi:hypothetical protein
MNGVRLNHVEELWRIAAQHILGYLVGILVKVAQESANGCISE